MDAGRGYFAGRLCVQTEERSSTHPHRPHDVGADPRSTDDHHDETTGRIQLALNVADLAAAVRVYSDMFGTGPSKERPGYANFAIADPPLKLVLFENPDATSPLNHLGVELGSTADVGTVAARFADAGLEHTQSVVDRCCHAVQDKVWVERPGRPARSVGVLHRPGR